MNEQDMWRIARVALTAVGEHGYMLAGSLALRAHGVTGRPMGDIDLFALPGSDGATAHAELTAALTGAGYQVQTSMYSDGGRAANLDVHDPRQPAMAPVQIQLAQVMMDFEPQHIDGLPVMAIGDCIHLKGEALRTLAMAKDFLDLYYLNLAYGADFVDEHLGANTAADAYSLRLMLSEVGDIPDESFALYQLTPADAADLRHHVLDWANDILPDIENHLKVSSKGPAAGLHALDQDQAVQAWERIAANQPLSLNTDYEIARELVEAAEGITGSAKSASAKKLAEAATAWALRLREEIQRRMRLSSDDRAAEVAVRREYKGLGLGEQEPTQASVLARVTAVPTPHQDPYTPGQEASNAEVKPQAPDHWRL
ncbi:hypothetical protein GCM10010411_76090 [Actinomadura fulvescens]|uniref:Nucleotidyltransferase n=1 Tax=Actinomadura fulvescens TaxID=46160 RepID=A0ABP6CWD3_9ACTN